MLFSNCCCKLPSDITCLYLVPYQIACMSEFCVWLLSYAVPRLWSYEGCCINMQAWLVILCVAQTGRIYDIPGCMSLAEPCKLQSCQIAGSEPWGTNWNCFERMFFCGGHEIRVCAPNIWLLHNMVILGEELEANCHQRNSSSPKRPSTLRKPTTARCLRLLHSKILPPH